MTYDLRSVYTVDKQNTLEELQEKLNDEAEKWEKANMSLDQTQHSNSTLYLLKQQLQAVINLLLKQGTIDENDINIELKELMLNDMTAMRMQVQQEKMEALIGSRGDIQIAKSSKVFGLDGQEIKF